MPDNKKYKIYYTGAEIEQAIHNALNMKDTLESLNIIGVQKLGDGTSQVDLNTVTEPGYYVVDKYTNGPSWSTTDETVSPIMVGVFEVESGDTTYTYQTITAYNKTATRSKESAVGSYGAYTEDTESVIVDGQSITGVGEVSLFGVTNSSITATEGSHFIMKSPAKNAAEAQVQVNGTSYPIYSVAGEKLPAGAFGPNAYIEFYFGTNPETSSGLVLFTTGIGSVAGSGEDPDPSTDPDVKQLQQDVKKIQQTMAGITNPGVIVNTAPGGSPVVLVASTMTKEEADAIHALTTSDDSKSKLVATDSTGKLVASELTLEEANNIHALGIGSAGGATSGSLLFAADLKQGTQVEVDDIPVPAETPEEPGEP